MSALGTQVLVDLHSCNAQSLSDKSQIESLMTEAAERAGASIVATTFHHFSPLGVSGVVVIAESHIAIHTWPEHAYAAVDIFTCGDTIDPWIIRDHLLQGLDSKSHTVTECKRGAHYVAGNGSHAFSSN